MNPITIPSFIEMSYAIDWPETTLADGEVSFPLDPEKNDPIVSEIVCKH